MCPLRQVAALQAKQAMDASGVHNKEDTDQERQRKQEQHDRDMQVLSQWARENRASSVLTDYRGKYEGSDALYSLSGNVSQNDLDSQEFDRQSSSMGLFGSAEYSLRSDSQADLHGAQMLLIR